MYTLVGQLLELLLKIGHRLAIKRQNAATARDDAGIERHTGKSRFNQSVEFVFPLSYLACRAETTALKDEYKLTAVWLADKVQSHLLS